MQFSSGKPVGSGEAGGFARGPRRTVVLRHEGGAGGDHYDWMIEDPACAEGEGALLTWRVAVAPWEWAAGRQVELTELGAHRRAYLTYEGPIRGGRGTVRRVDEGTVCARAWSGSRAELAVRMGRFTGVVRLERAGEGRWSAKFE